MNILAVSDQESLVLMSWVEKKLPELEKIDVIISAGDLSHEYLEVLSMALGKEVLFVRGNHDQKEKWTSDAESFPNDIFSIPVFRDNNQFMVNIHGKIRKMGNWLILGLEGSRWYNGEGTQYSESKMRRMVETLIIKSKTKVWLEKALGQRREWIVVSHAPLFGIHDEPDLCHRGFECYYEILKFIKPKLWIHGHTRAPSLTSNQISQWGQTSILNAFEYKFIRLETAEAPAVSFKPSILL